MVSLTLMDRHKGVVEMGVKDMKQMIWGGIQDKGNGTCRVKEWKNLPQILEVREHCDVC